MSPDCTQEDRLTSVCSLQSMMHSSLSQPLKAGGMAALCAPFGFSSYFLCRRSAPMSASCPVFHTRLCDLLGIDYPILQSGMGGIAGPDLVATVTNAGGLGIL